MKYKKGREMKTFVITTVLRVADACQNRSADINMVRRYVNELSQSRVVDKPSLRGQIVLKVENVKSEVFEIFNN